MLEAHYVSKSYGSDFSGKKQALTNVNVSIGPREIVGVFGRNGAGKTTLLRCLAGTIRPTYGSVTVDGQERNIGWRVSFAPGEGSFFPDRTIREHREFFRYLIGDFDTERFDKLLEFFGLEYTDRPRTLSTGQKSRFEIACTLGRRVPYYLFDEPMFGHDINTRRDFLRLLSGLVDESQSVVVSTHLAAEIEPLLSRAVVLNRGRMVSDLPIEQLQAEEGTLVRHLLHVGGYDSEKAMDLLDLDAP